MLIRVYTLVDVTNSKVTDPAKKLPYHQEQNLNTLLRTIDMRSQPFVRSTWNKTWTKSNRFHYEAPYTCWAVEIELDHNIDVRLLQADLHYTPVVTKLKETVEVPVPVFDTKDRINTYFSIMS